MRFAALAAEATTTSSNRRNPSKCIHIELSAPSIALVCWSILSPIRTGCPAVSRRAFSSVFTIYSYNSRFSRNWLRNTDREDHYHTSTHRQQFRFPDRKHKRLRPIVRTFALVRTGTLNRSGVCWNLSG